MKTRGLFANGSGITQGWILISGLLVGSILSSVLVMGGFFLFNGFSANILDYPYALRLLQFFSAIGTFLFPAIVVAWFCSEDPLDYLSVRRFPRGNILLLLFLSTFLLSPAISLTGLLNKQMALPDSLAFLEEWMQMREQEAEALTNKLMEGSGIWTLLSNLVVVALMAGLAEEFFFRGALQRVVGKWARNHHIVIWSVAFLFSAFHLQFYGFLPRMLLGGYFGYLLYWSKNIWLPVFAHLANNAFAVIGMSNAKLKDNEFVTGDISQEHLMAYTILAVISLYIFFLVNRKLFRMVSKNPSSGE